MRFADLSLFSFLRFSNNRAAVRVRCRLISASPLPELAEMDHHEKQIECNKVNGLNVAKASLNIHMHDVLRCVL